jgi:hypothetical protein
MAQVVQVQMKIHSRKCTVSAQCRLLDDDRFSSYNVGTSEHTKERLPTGI